MPVSIAGRRDRSRGRHALREHRRRDLDNCRRALRDRPASPCSTRAASTFASAARSRTSSPRSTSRPKSCATWTAAPSSRWSRPKRRSPTPALEVTASAPSGSASFSGRRPAAWSRMPHASSRSCCERGPDRVSPMFLPHFLPDRRPAWWRSRSAPRARTWPSRSACATGSHAIGEAFETILRDDADVMRRRRHRGQPPAGDLRRLHQHARAVDAQRRARQRASPPVRRRPRRLRDRRRLRRAGARGAGACPARGARIYCEVVGYGSGNDAYHMVQPTERGAGAAR